MSPSPLVTRIICAGVLSLCGVIVLAISAHVESSIRTFGLSTSTFSYDAFVGAFTLVFEVLFLIFRFALPNGRIVTFASEIGYAALLWLFWFASGISTTVTTEEGRSVCKHLNDLFDVPELKDLDPEALVIAKKALQSACSEIHAELAFIWIAWVVATFTVGYLTVLAVRQHTRGTKQIWHTSIRSYDHAAQHHTDPFADPVGQWAGPVVGVAEDEDPDRK